MMADFDLKAHRARAEKAWSTRAQWDALYGEVYDWIIPYRRPGEGRTGPGKAARRLDHLMDSTAIKACFNGAGKLHQDLFPPGVPFFKLEAGPLGKLVAKADSEEARSAFTRNLEAITEQIAPFFQTGEWDASFGEMCLDLFAGTGVMLIVDGDGDMPVRFVTLPIDEIALGEGAYGVVDDLFWRSHHTRRALKAMFPKGSFPEEFEKAVAKDGADEPVLLCQDFTAEYVGRGANQRRQWRFVAWLKDAPDGAPPVVTAVMKTRPFIAPRYYKVPGEAYGRGPAMIAVPTTKTLNKTMELTLKGASIQMLGLWGWRPGGAFNPEQARLAPGAMWPMQSTGGVMGPDVVRLDPAAARMDVSQIVLQDLRQQLHEMLNDERLPEGGGTPRSAAEITARMSRLKQLYLGSFGRILAEIVPHVVPRVIEILARRRLITTDIKIDRLLVNVQAVSPLAQAMRAQQYQTAMEAVQLILSVEGPQGLQRRLKTDEMFAEILADLGVAAKWIRDAVELKTFDAQASKAAETAAVTQAALDKPDKFAQALAPPEQGLAPPPM